jgi:MerR family transcriptional regulator, repressor of the yfmOP operon
MKAQNVSSAPAEERSYRIGEVAERVGITTRTIRYYEELGLLGTASTRMKGTHRLYTEADIARLEELIRLRDLLGLTLEELTALAEAQEARAALRDEWAESASDRERARIVREAIPLVERQLDLVRRRQQRLSEFADELSAKLRSLRARRAELERNRPGA